MKKFIVFFLPFLCHCLCSVAASYASDRNKGAILTVTYSKRVPPKKMQVDYFENGLSGPTPAYQTSIIRTERDKSSRFIFRVSMLRKLGYVSLSEIDSVSGNKHLVFVKFLLEKGDSIHVYLEPDSAKTQDFNTMNEGIDAAEADRYQSTYNINFSGQGSEKFTYRFACNHLFDNIYLFSIDQHAEQEADSLLNSIRNDLTPLALQVIRADQIGKQSQLVTNDFLYLSFPHIEQRYPQELAHVRQKFTEASLSDEAIDLSAEICSYFIANAQQAINSSAPDSIYYFLRDNYSGRLRERLVVNHLLFCISQNVLDDNVLINAIRLVADREYGSYLHSEYSRLLPPGKVAYNFSLQNTDGKPVRLSDFKGKLVFLDFWFTGCRACSDFYLHVIRPVEQQFKRSDIVFVSISLDQQKKTWINSLASGKYSSADAIHLYTNGKGADHEVIRMYKANISPRLILIDKQGKIISDKYEQLGGADKIQKKFHPEYLEKIIRSHL